MQWYDRMKQVKFLLVVMAVLIAEVLAGRDGCADCRGLTCGFPLFGA